MVLRSRGPIPLRADRRGSSSPRASLSEPASRQSNFWWRPLRPQLSHRRKKLLTTPHRFDQQCVRSATRSNCARKAATPARGIDGSRLGMRLAWNFRARVRGSFRRPLLPPVRPTERRPSAAFRVLAERHSGGALVERRRLISTSRQQGCSSVSSRHSFTHSFTGRRHFGSRTCRNVHL
jgi:hypothetical protein